MALQKDEEKQHHQQIAEVRKGNRNGAGVQKQDQDTVEPAHCHQCPEPKQPRRLKDLV